MGRRSNKSWSSHIKKVTVDGHVFDSQREATRYNELVLLEKAGEIGRLKCHTKYPLQMPDGRPLLIRSKGYPNGRKSSYTDDFSYDVADPDCQKKLLSIQEVLDGVGLVRVIEDVKGFDTPMARYRRSVFELLYDMRITLVT